LLDELNSVREAAELLPEAFNQLAAELNPVIRRPTAQSPAPESVATPDTLETDDADVTGFGDKV
jgi:hypothetical protein